MKKLLRMLLATSLLTMMAAVVASAEIVTYQLKEYNASANEYDLVINVQLEGTEQTTTFATTIAMNNKVIGPVSTESGYITTASKTVTEGRNPVTYSYILLDSKWTVNGDTTELLVSCVSSDFDKFDHDSLDILTIPLKLANGVTPDDITANDFQIKKAYLATNSGVQGKPGNFYGLNEPTIPTPFNNLVNNVVPAVTLDIAGDGIKNVTEGSGIRYKTTFAKSFKDTVSEYGFIATNTSSELNLALVEAGKAVKGVAYDEDTDDFWSETDTDSLVTAVIVGVPLNKTALTTDITIRPYYVLSSGGKAVYGKSATNSVYEIAKAIATENGEAYKNNKAYIDSVIATVEANDSDVVINIEKLFSIEA